MKRKLNFEVLCQLILLVGLAILILLALITGKAQDYVYPRLNGFLWFSVAALLLIGFFLLPGLWRPKHRAGVAKYLVLLLPMITAVLLPVGAVQSKAVTFGSLTASTPVSEQKGTVIPNKIVSKDDIGIDVSSAPPPEPKKGADGVTTVSGEAFSDWYGKLNLDMKQYEGQVFRFKGQVFRMSDFAKK
jgi:Domain of unknown function (DUF1980).